MRGTYSHSGKLGLGPLVVPVLGVVTTLLLSMVYAYVNIYSPIVGIVSLLVLCAYAFGLVMALRLAAKVAKVRNTGFMTLVGALVGLFAVYSSWAAFMAVLFAKAGLGQASYLGFLISPGDLWEATQLVNQNGWYSVGDSTPTGGALWLIWAIEALVIFGGGVIGGLAAISDSVFCETCDEWAEEVKPAAIFALPESRRELEEVLSGAASGDLDALAGLASSRPVLGALLQIELLCCETCNKTATFQVNLVKRSMEDGKESEDTDNLSPQILIGPEDVARIKELARRPPGTGGAEQEEEEGPEQEEDLE